MLARVHHSGGEFASWRWAFLAMAVLALVSVVITVVAARDSSSPSGRSLDWPGQITIAIALFALIYSVVQGAADGWGSGVIIGGFVVAAVFLAIFVAIERRVDKPLIQLDLFSNRMFTVSAVVTVLGMFAYLGTAYGTSIRLSAIQNYTPLKTSVGFVLLNIMGVILFPVSTKMLQKLNPGWVLAAGMALIGIGDVALAAIPATHLGLAAVAVPLLVVGAGFKIAVTAITVVAVNSVPTSKAGMASGATSMLRDFGLTLGPAIVAAIGLTTAASTISAKDRRVTEPAQGGRRVQLLGQDPAAAQGCRELRPARRERDPEPAEPAQGRRVPRAVARLRRRLSRVWHLRPAAALIAALMLGGRAHTHAFVDVAETADLH